MDAAGAPAPLLLLLFVVQHQVKTGYSRYPLHFTPDALLSITTCHVPSQPESQIYLNFGSTLCAPSLSILTLQLTQLPAWL